MTFLRTGGRALAAACALVLLAAACGGDDDSAETTDASTTVGESTTTTADEETTTTAAEDESDDESEDEDADESDDEPEESDADDADDSDDEPEEPGGSSEDQALAEAVALDEDDFTAEWTAEESDDDETDITECFTDVDLASVQLAEFDSPTFSQQEGENYIASGATGIVLEDADTAEAILDESLTNQFAGCALDQVLAALSESGLTIVESDLSPAPGVPNLAEQTTALNGFYSLEDADGTVYDGELSLWFIRTANVITGVSVFDLGDTEFATVVDEVTDVVGDKHAAEVE